MAQALKILLLIGAGYVGLCLLVFLFQSRLVFFPSDDRAGTPADKGLGFEEVWLDSQGNRVQAWFVPAKASRGAVLFCHGNAGNITHRLDTLRILHGLGMDVLIFDYQGYGRSQGSPGENAAYADARAAWDWLMARGVEPGRVVVMGRSLGGGVAAGLVDSLDVKPAGLVLESTFTSVADMGAARFPYLPVRLLCRYSFDTLSRVERVACPVLAIHSPDDDIVPFAHGQALFQAFQQAGKDADFLDLSGDHNSGWLASEIRYVQGLDRFFSRVLPSGD